MGRCGTVDHSDMKRPFVLAYFMATAVAAVQLPAPAHAQVGAPLAGIWTLNRALSEFRADIGFNVDWMPAPTGDGQNAGSNAGGRGRRGSTGGGGNRGPAAPFSGRRESSEDARRVQLLTAEARNPPSRLTVVDTPAAVTITNELGQSRAFHPDVREESINVQGVPIAVTTKRDGDRLVVVYHVEPDRELRYTFSHAAYPSQLIVDVQFLEHGAGDKARRVYEAGVTTEAPRATGADTTSAPSNPRTPDTFDQRPGAELVGLKNLGIVVEDLSAQAIACGLNHDSIEGALSKRLTEGGFAVRKNSDEDTYVYVNVMTNRLSDGTCVSRYDAFLYTHATATLSYRDKSVLVQVSLMHRGGIGSSAPAAHAAAVTRGLQSYVDLFVTQVRDANK
jgi:hypothetical protein